MVLSPLAADTPEYGNTQELFADVSKLPRRAIGRQPDTPPEFNSLRCIQKLDIDPFVASKVVHFPDLFLFRKGAGRFRLAPRLPCPVSGCSLSHPPTAIYLH